MWLRVPGLRYSKAKGLVYAVLFALLDATVFGTLGVSKHIHSYPELIEADRLPDTRYGRMLPTCSSFSEKVCPRDRRRILIDDELQSLRTREDK